MTREIRDGLIIGLLIILALMTTFRTADRFTHSQASQIVMVRDAQAEIRTQWLEALTAEICTGKPEAELCGVDWRERITEIATYE